MPLCYLFTSSRTAQLSRYALQHSVQRHGEYTLSVKCPESLNDCTSTQEDGVHNSLSDFADRPRVISTAHTHIYIVHLVGNRFAFTLNGEAFQPTEFLHHLRRHSQSINRIVFASCLAFRDVWTQISDKMGANEQTLVSVLIVAKQNISQPLTDVNVLTWLSTLNWSRHFLGLSPGNANGGVVERFNLKWKWLIL